ASQSHYQAQVLMSLCHTGKSSAANSSHTTRILCWIMTGPKNLESRTKHIRETWAKRCDRVLYMSSVKTDFPTVELNVSEGRDNLYWKTIRAFQYIHEHHFDEADWFLKADDDTFVVIENLRYTLSKYDPEKPLYLGYMSGGAGYVLSKEALRRFIKGFDSGECTHFSTIEDMALGKCMETMKVEPADSRDMKGRQTFHPYPPDHYLVRQFPRPRPWFLLYEHYTPVEGPGCCSDLVYLTYHLRPYGYKYRFNPDEHIELNSSKQSKYAYFPNCCCYKELVQFVASSSN
uniref:Glycoprotein-N-acetylgalactosamine 3-beta-galactosyltransferase 1 n=1 Tax=Lates calcarifer TaxID=8187 RepID=A0A4W6CK83_LATCA